MAKIAMPTAPAAAHVSSGMKRVAVTPIAAEIPCPPKTAQGPESSPSGTQKSKTALAPIDATKSWGRLSPTTVRPTRKRLIMAMALPQAAIRGEKLAVFGRAGTDIAPILSQNICMNSE
jgi:hypothetical protein